MGWSIGYDSQHKRDIGYGVPAICDHPDCDEEIDRGLTYKCESCGLFFCEHHLTVNDECEQVCYNCESGYLPHAPKHDTQEWINHKLTDESWEKWRSENQEWVKLHQK